jgi:STE24 endopeptidase
MHLAAIIIAGLIIAKWAAQQWLELINRRHVLANAGTVPAAYAGAMDPASYRKSVDYTLAKVRVQRFELTWDAFVLAAFLFSGVLPWSMAWFKSHLGASAWSLGLFLFVTGLALSLTGLPWSWYHQFKIEELFGFNRSTQKIWWMDRVKGLLLGVVLGYPIVVLVLKLVEWTGAFWWIWAWAALFVFQLLLAVLAPVLILPLFNKLTPLPEGMLRERLLGMARKTQFRAQSIQVMDGSKRSRHSNAFFTGFGAFRKIVLFDTLIQQLAEPELEAVLAHEIGHYKRKHIPRMLLFSAAASLAGFFVLSLLARADWFYAAFGFQAGSVAPALLLFTLTSGLVTFWFSPVAHVLSRKYEYEADAFAAKAMEEPQPLIEALRKLNRENLSNMNPHPFYSGFYYSHPTLLEREAALRSLTLQAGA